MKVHLLVSELYKLTTGSCLSPTKPLHIITHNFQHLFSKHPPSTLRPRQAFFHWLYIPGWDMTSSVIFTHFSLAHRLILQFLHQPFETSFCNTSRHLNFGQPLLSPFPPCLVERTFIAGSLSLSLFHPHHMSSPSTSTTLDKFPIMLYAFFWVIPRRLNFICRRFGRLCSIFRGVEWLGLGNVGVFIREKIWLENSLSQ